MSKKNKIQESKAEPAWSINNDWDVYLLGQRLVIQLHAQKSIGKLEAYVEHGVEAALQ